MTYEPTCISSQSDSDGAACSQEELLEWLECDDFWWDEEDRHELI